MLCSKWGAARGAATWIGSVVRAISPSRRCADAEVELRPTALGECPGALRGSVRLVVLSGQPITFAEEQCKNLRRHMGTLSQPFVRRVARSIDQPGPGVSTPLRGLAGPDTRPRQGRPEPTFCPPALGLSGPPALHIRAPAPDRLWRYNPREDRPQRRSHCGLQIPHPRAAPCGPLLLLGPSDRARCRPMRPRQAPTCTTDRLNRCAIMRRTSSFKVRAWS